MKNWLYLVLGCLLAQSANAERYKTFSCAPVNGTKLDDSTIVKPNNELSNIFITTEHDKKRALVALIKDDYTYEGAYIYDLIAESGLSKRHYLIASSKHGAGLILDTGAKKAKRYFISPDSNWTIEYFCEPQTSVYVD